MNEELRHEIVRRRQGGASLRRIAKDLKWTPFFGQKKSVPSLHSCRSS
jgi:hypothetical protein